MARSHWLKHRSICILRKNAKPFCCSLSSLLIGRLFSDSGMSMISFSAKVIIASSQEVDEPWGVLGGS
jgi:hypothetical protein